MRIARARVVPFRLTAAAPVVGARQAIRERVGVLLVLEDEAGTIGIGEASPLPGWSRDGLGSTRASLEFFAGAAARSLHVVDEPSRSDLARARDHAGPLTSAAACAVDAALADLMGQRLGVPAHALWRDASSPPDAIPLNALVPAGDPVETLAVARAAFDRGVRTFKLKIGREDGFEAECASLEALRDHFGASVSLRVDTNQAWPPELADERLDALASFDLALIEEPVVQGRFDLITAEGARLAADESLATSEGVTRALAAPACVALVIKPMAQGGAIGALALARQARSAGRDVVITHLFGGPVAHATACEVALALDPPPLACGLDRHALLDAAGVVPPQVRAATVKAAARPGLGLDAAAVLKACGVAT